MMRARSILLLAVPLAAGLICTWQALRLAGERRAFADAQADAVLVSNELAELKSLDAASQQFSWGARPDADVLALARSAVSAAGLPSDTLQGITPTGDRPVPGQPNGGVQLREQSVRISLRAINAPTFGSFLRAWQEAAPRWTVTSIELAAADGRGSRQGVFTGSLIVVAPYAQGGTP